MGCRARRVAMATAVAVLMVGRADPAGAAFITYTESIQGQGSLGQQGFSGLLTLSLTADTSGITHASSYYYSAHVTTATVTAGGLTATFVDPLYVTVGANVLGQGFASFTDLEPLAGGMTILDVLSPAFAGYNLSTPFGPATGFGSAPLGDFSTSLGALSFMATGTNGTFTATAAAVPESSSLALGGIAAGIGLVAGAARRRRALA